MARSRSAKLCIVGESESWAAAMFAQHVSPPTEGMDSARRIEMAGGFSAAVMSACLGLIDCDTFRVSDAGCWL